VDRLGVSLTGLSIPPKPRPEASVRKAAQRGSGSPWSPSPTLDRAVICVGDRRSVFVPSPSWRAVSPQTTGRPSGWRGVVPAPPWQPRGEPGTWAGVKWRPSCRRRAVRVVRLPSQTVPSPREQHMVHARRGEGWRASWTWPECSSRRKASRSVRGRVVRVFPCPTVPSDRTATGVTMHAPTERTPVRRALVVGPG